MTALLFIGSTLSFLIGLLIFVIAKGGIHEATGSLFFVVSAILFSGAVLHRGINRVIDALGHIDISIDMLRKHSGYEVPQPHFEAATAIVEQSKEEPVSPANTTATPSPRTWVDDAREQIRKDKNSH